MASKLHGVDVDIKIIKRKGEPLNPPPPSSNQPSTYFDYGRANIAAGKDDVNQQNSGGSEASMKATEITTNNNNNNLSRCSNEFMSSNDRNGLSYNKDGDTSK